VLTALTKYWHHQNIGVDKYYFGVDKILALTKYWHAKGADAADKIKYFKYPLKKL
jgi:hypothetical protein